MFTKERIENILKNIEQEIQNYSIDILDSLQDLKIDDSFVTNINREIIKRKDYINLLNKIKKYISYILNNINDLVYNDEKYSTKNAELLRLLIKINDKFGLNISIENNITTNNSNTFPILGYHSVSNTPWGDYSLFIKTEEFKKQMLYLKENGYTPLFLSEISQAKNYEKPIIITFSDGYKEVYNNAWPVLEELGIKANVFIISDWINGEVYMNDKMIEQLASSSLIEIGSNTKTYSSLNNLEEEQLIPELSESKQALEKLTNKTVTTLSYPSNNLDEKATDIVSKYYEYTVCSSDGKEIKDSFDPYCLKRVFIYRDNDINNFKNKLEN